MPSTSAYLDIDALERLLLRAARSGRALGYGEVLGAFGRRVGRGSVAALCRDLGQVCRRNRERGEPELAVLVVRSGDRLPGEGYFRDLRAKGIYAGPSTGPEAEAIVAELQGRVFAHFGAPPAISEDLRAWLADAPIVGFDPARDLEPAAAEPRPLARAPART